MRHTYVGLLGVAVAIQGVMAQDDALVPNRKGPLEADHPANSHPQSKSACYQDSEGQILDNGSTLQYPCISQLRIEAYCSREEFKKDREAQKQCFFGPTSTFTRDYEGCLACKAYNGQATQKWFDDQKAFIRNLKTKFVDENPNNDNFQTVYEKNKPADPKGPFIPSKAKIVNGTADINILSYYENPPAWQGTNVSLPRGAEQVPVNAEPATGGAGGEANPVQASFEIFYPAVISLRQGNEQAASYRFQNTSSTDVTTAGGAKGLVCMKISGSVAVSIDVARAQAEANSTLNFHDVVKTTGISVSKNEPLPNTAVKIEAGSSAAVQVQNNVIYNADRCGCFEKSPFSDAQLASPAARGNGVPATELTAGSKITIVAHVQGSIMGGTGRNGGAQGGGPVLTGTTPVAGRPASGGNPAPGGRPASGGGAPVTSNQAPVSKEEAAAKVEAAARVGITAEEAESLPWCD